jgi:hypothetical protein
MGVNRFTRYSGCQAQLLFPAREARVNGGWLVEVVPER